MKKLYRNDLILLCAVLILCILIPSLIFIKNNEENVRAVISHDGIPVYQISLEDNKTVTVNGVEIQIKNGEVRAVSSTCPDRLCVDMGSISRAGESIICVPNKVSVTISDAGESEDVVIAG